MRIRPVFFAIGLATSAVANEPLSAIDWLSESVEPIAQPAPKPQEPQAQGVETPDITVTALDAPSLDGIGVLAPQLTGYPISLWSTSDADTLATLVATQDLETLPALTDTLTTLMLAQADSPLNAGPDGRFFISRVDLLLRLGAVEAAAELLSRIDPTSPEVLRRAFDVALLTGSEDEVCNILRDRPSIAPTFSARIFCLARSGDWSAAALTLNTGKALGKISEDQDALLVRFLDLSLDDDKLLPGTGVVTPLEFRLREAIGEPVSTRNLPPAFAHADLRSVAGWKAQIEAAEKLARRNAISANRLLGIYTERTPAASGGVWDRAEAIQRLETALITRDPTAVSTQLPAAWQAAKTAQIEIAFADIFAAKLQGLPLDSAAQALAYEIGFLSDDYETIARSITDKDFAFLKSIALGETPTRADTLKQRAIQAGFSQTALGPLADMTDQGQLGEALLRSIAALTQSLATNDSALSQGLALFRSVGLEDVARKTALQHLILDRSL